MLRPPYGPKLHGRSRVPKPKRRAACRRRVASHDWRAGRVTRGDCSPLPLEIRTCWTTASGSSDHGFAARVRGPQFTIRRSSGDTVTTRARCLTVFPFDDSVIRRSPSLHWLPRLPRATVRQLHRYYQSAPTSHRPSRPTPLRSTAVPRTAARREAAGSCCFRLLLNPSAFDSPSCRRWDLPGSPSLFASMRCSSTPADLVHQAIAMHQRVRAGGHTFDL